MDVAILPKQNQIGRPRGHWPQTSSLQPLFDKGRFNTIFHRPLMNHIGIAILTHGMFLSMILASDPQTAIMSSILPSLSLFCLARCTFWPARMRGLADLGLKSTVTVEAHGPKSFVHVTNTQCMMSDVGVLCSSQVPQNSLQEYLSCD